jgi:hypothetical protein
LNDYDQFVAAKRRCEVATGHMHGDLNPSLFDFQRAIVACREQQNISDACREQIGLFAVSAE